MYGIISYKPLGLGSYEESLLEFIQRLRGFVNHLPRLIAVVLFINFFRHQYIHDVAVPVASFNNSWHFGAFRVS